MKTTNNFYDMITLLYFVIKEKFDWVGVGYWTMFCVTVNEALFWGSVGYFGCVGHYFGWVGEYGALFWVVGGEWGIILGGWVNILGAWGWVGVGELFDNAQMENGFSN